MAAGLLTPSNGYRPFRYPFAYDLWKRQQQVHWMPEEVPMGEDVKDWHARLTPAEQSLVTHIFRYFTQSDVEVADNYMERVGRTFKPTEVKMMLAAFSNMETVHIAAYANLVDTLGMPETTFSAFMDYDEMRTKSEYNRGFGMKTHRERLLNLAHFGGFTEGLQLFAAFAVLMNFPRFGKLKGMGQIISWSVRDESLHCEGIIKLFHAYAQETGALTDDIRNEIRQDCEHVVYMEDRLVDLIFGAGPVDGITPEELKSYIRFIADWRLRQLGLPELFGVRENPLDWLQSMLSGVEHANFFENRSTEYSKAASSGDWGKTWARFDAGRRAA